MYFQIRVTFYIQLALNLISFCTGGRNCIIIHMVARKIHDFLLWSFCVLDQFDQLKSIKSLNSSFNSFSQVTKLSNCMLQLLPSSPSTSSTTSLNSFIQLTLSSQLHPSTSQHHPENLLTSSTLFLNTIPQVSQLSQLFPSSPSAPSTHSLNSIVQSRQLPHLSPSTPSLKSLNSPNSLSQLLPSRLVTCDLWLANLCNFFAYAKLSNIRALAPCTCLLACSYSNIANPQAFCNHTCNSNPFFALMHAILHSHCNTCFATGVNRWSKFTFGRIFSFEIPCCHL